MAIWFLRRPYLVWPFSIAETAGANRKSKVGNRKSNSLKGVRLRFQLRRDKFEFACGGLNIEGGKGLV